MDEQRLLGAVLPANPGKEKFVLELQDISAHSLYERAILQYDNPVASSEKGRSEERG